MARILIAEDDVAAQSFVARALSQSGHVVASVDDGLQALEALGAADYDLLITDIVMPGLDGIGLALKVARDWPELPILLMTGYAEERRRVHNLDEIILKVISKPFTLEQICREAATALAHRTTAATGATTGP